MHMAQSLWWMSQHFNPIDNIKNNLKYFSIFKDKNKITNEIFFYFKNKNKKK